MRNDVKKMILEPIKNMSEKYEEMVDDMVNEAFDKHVKTVTGRTVEELEKLGIEISSDYNWDRKKIKEVRQSLVQLRSL